MMQQGETTVNNVAVSAFHRAHLIVSVRASAPMRDAGLLQKSCEGYEFPHCLFEEL